MTDQTGTKTPDTEPETEAPRFTPPVRGRHRRPRPRRVLFAVGGLALAAGVLSFVRMAPESLVGGAGGAEAEPRVDAASDGAGNAVTTVEAVPTATQVTAAATTVMGGASPAPASGVSLAPTPSATASPTPTGIPTSGIPTSGVPDTTGATGIPTAPAPSHTPPPATTAAPQPTPSTPTRTAHPKPSAPDLCVPIVGLCVNGLAEPGAHG